MTRGMSVQCDDDGCERQTRYNIFCPLHCSASALHDARYFSSVIFACVALREVSCPGGDTRAYRLAVSKASSTKERIEKEQLIAHRKRLTKHWLRLSLDEDTAQSSPLA